MGSFFNHLFKRGQPSSTTAANASEEGGSIGQEFREFCETFYFQPGQLLMPYLVSNKVYRLVEWLKPSTPEPEPKSFIRLANDATRRGVEVWKQKGVEMYLDGHWSQGGGPSQESRDCLSVLAQILGLEIKVYYRPIEDGELMVLVFEP